MTSIAAGAARPRARDLLWRRPDWWVISLSATAWVALVSGHHLHGTAEGGAMIVAMMVPLSAPAMRDLALASFKRRRHLAQVLFLTGYVGTWMLVYALLSAAVIGAMAVGGTLVAIAISFGAAALWQLAGPKARALRRCGGREVSAASGWRANRDCLLYGARKATECVVTCWALMAALVAAGHGVALMGVLFVLQVQERGTGGFRPRASAWAIVGIGVLTVVSTVLVA